MLTTGFDAPNIDCVAIVRPTHVAGALLSDVSGRVSACIRARRTAWFSDFGGNVLRHGPVDQIRVRENGPIGKGGEGPGQGMPRVPCADRRRLFSLSRLRL